MLQASGFCKDLSQGFPMWTALCGSVAAVGKEADEIFGSAAAGL